MFRLINKQDSKVFSRSMIIKNADFFKDEIAFFDAYNEICEKNINEIPNYCSYNGQKLCLEGICLFMKSYASKLGFVTLDLSIDYLKTLYYAISSLSENGESVSRDVVIHEYLVYKEANKKYCENVGKKLEEIEIEYEKNLSKFNESEKVYLKTSNATRIFKILSILSIILFCAMSVTPVTFYYMGELTLKTAMVFAIASIAAGIILKIEFKILANYFKELSSDEAYSLQALKKNKDESFKSLTDIKIKNCKVLCEAYEYENGLEKAVVIDFDEVFKLAIKNNIISYNIKNDILKLDSVHQDNIYEMIDKIANVNIGDVGRLENLYGQINNEDYLRFNGLIKITFLNKFIENAIETKQWKLRLSTSQVDPFNIDAKSLADEKIVFLENDKGQFLVSNLSLFFNTKYAKNQKGLHLNNVKDEASLNITKYEYIKQFYDYALIENKENKESFKSGELRKIPNLIALKLALLKNRIVCNTLGEKDFLNAREIIKNYETSLKDIKTEYIPEKLNLITEKTDENKEFIKALYECDEIIDQGNGEVIMTYQGKQFRGFKFSNI